MFNTLHWHQHQNLRSQKLRSFVFFSLFMTTLSSVVLIVTSVRLMIHHGASWYADIRQQMPQLIGISHLSSFSPSVLSQHFPDCTSLNVFSLNTCIQQPTRRVGLCGATGLSLQPT
ncbi:MAG: hypothetical protein ACI8WB_003571 [Phenylobacterium sp.]|jgi:hypothetical protein